MQPADGWIGLFNSLGYSVSISQHPDLTWLALVMRGGQVSGTGAGSRPEKALEAAYIDLSWPHDVRDQVAVSGVGEEGSISPL